MCGSKTHATAQSVMRCNDPLADGYDAFRMGGSEFDSKLPLGSIGWYLFHEGWVIAKRGFPVQSFAFAPCCDRPSVGRPDYYRFLSHRTGTGKIDSDDENFPGMTFPNRADNSGLFGL